MMRHVRYTALLALALLTACAQSTGPVVTNDVDAPPSAPPTATTAPAPSATSQPTATAQPTPTLVAAASSAPTPEPAASTPAASKTITITAPAAGGSITNPVRVTGTTNFWPFEATLTGRIVDASGHQIGIGPVMVNAPDIGLGGPFDATIPFIAPREAQAGVLELFEVSAKDGSIVVQQRIPVQLAAELPQPTSGLQLDTPAAGVAVTLPLHVAFRGAEPGTTLTARLRWSNGTTLEQAVPVVTGSDGVGYGVANVQWNTESMPPPTPAGAATFELIGADGAILRAVDVQMLPEEQTQPVEVAWTAGNSSDLIVFRQAIGKTPQVASAALRELLNGPAEGNAAGAQTALPTLEEIVTYGGRGPDWGYEVRLIKLTITDGVATANFSKELRAYGGGAARVGMIRQQIERTLRQFSSVSSVVIQIEGQSAGELQP